MSSETLIPGNVEKAQTPFEMTPEQLAVVHHAANGLTIPESAKKLGTTRNAIINLRRNLGMFGYEESSGLQPIQPDTSLLALIRDGINFGYIKMNIDTPIEVYLTPFEEHVLDGIADGKKFEEISPKIRSRNVKIHKVLKTAKRKLSTRSKHHTLAKYLWLKNRELVIVNDLGATPSKTNLTENQLQVMDLLVQGLSASEIRDRLVVTDGTVSSHRHNIAGVWNREHETNLKPLEAIMATIEDGIENEYLNYEPDQRKLILSPTNNELMSLIRQGKISPEIAQHFGISLQSAQRKIKNLLSYMEASTKYQAVAKYAWAKKNGTLYVGDDIRIFDTNQETIPFQLLTDQQKQIVQLLADGLERSEISDILGISISKVDRNLRGISNFNSSNSLPEHLAIVALLQDGIINGYLECSIDSLACPKKLTKTDRLILEGFCSGKKLRDISNESGISYTTLIIRNSELKDKLGSKNLFNTIAVYTALQKKGLISNTED